MTVPGVWFAIIESMKGIPLNLPKPSKKEFTTFAVGAGVSYVVAFAVAIGVMGYFAQNFAMFETLYNLKVVALSYINTLGLILITVTGILSLVLSVFYLKYIEGIWKS